MVARHGHVVEEHLRLRAATDRHTLAGDREALTRAPAARSDHERRALRHDRLEVDGLELAGLVQLVGDRGIALGHVAEIRTALLAVVRPLGIHEAALWTVHER